MSKLILSTALVSVVLFSGCSSKQADTKIANTAKVVKSVKQNEVKKEYFANGQLKIETPFVNGLENGVEKRYNEDGSILWECSFKDGKQSGIYKDYYPNGTLKMEVIYLDDKVHGTKKKYRKNGSLWWVSNYYDGVKNGIYKEYFENGNLYLQIPWVDAKQEGLKKEFYKNGSLKWELTFVNDKREGIYKEYAKNGTIIIKTPYINDKAEGESKEFYDNGQISSIVTYRNGKKAGLYKQFFRMKQAYLDSGHSPSLSWETHYINGKPVGTAISYWSGGSVAMKINFSNGKAVSGYRYNENGGFVRKTTNADYTSNGFEYI